MDGKRVYLVAHFDEGTNQRLADLYGKLVSAGLSGEQTRGIPYHFTLGSFDTASEAHVLARANRFTPVESV